MRRPFLCEYVCLCACVTTPVEAQMVGPIMTKIGTDRSGIWSGSILKKLATCMVCIKILMYNGAPLEQVKKLIYLGASFNKKGDTIKEVKRRIAIAKRASGNLHRIWRNRELPISLKRKLVQLMIWPIMSYGSETWIYLKSVQNMIKVFERWCYRRMLRISWTEHATNESRLALSIANFAIGATNFSLAKLF